MEKRRHWLLLFMRRNVGRHKQDLPQRKSFRGSLCQGQVSAMNGIEASAEKPMFIGYLPDLRRQFRVFRRLLQVFVPPCISCTTDFF